MAVDKFLENLTEEQKNLGSRIFNLVIGRVLKNVYLNLDENSRGNMEKTFLSDETEEKSEFIKKYIPNLEKLLKETAEKIEEEIKEEIEKQT